MTPTLLPSGAVPSATRVTVTPGSPDPFQSANQTGNPIALSTLGLGSKFEPRTGDASTAKAESDAVTGVLGMVVRSCGVSMKLAAFEAATPFTGSVVPSKL